MLIGSNPSVLLSRKLDRISEKGNYDDFKRGREYARHEDPGTGGPGLMQVAV